MCRSDESVSFSLNTHELGTVLERLVTRGGAVVPSSQSDLLRTLAVADGPPGDSWMWPTQYYLETAIPAKDQTDLVRRALIRLPEYRLHLDLSLCSVVHAVAVAERWNRLEELLFGPCNSIAPRLAQLIEWEPRRRSKNPRDLTSIDWENSIVSNSHPAYLEWNRGLWGDNRGVQDLFQLLIDLYIPICSQPQVIHADRLTNPLLLASLIRAANDGEGISVHDSDVAEIEAMQKIGLPVRWESRTGNRACAFLVAPVAMSTKTIGQLTETCDVASRVPSIARHSRIFTQSTSDCPWGSISSQSISLFVPPSIDASADRWPNDAVSDSPSWLPLPGVEVLSSASKRRSDSHDADVALLQLARHPLYGFLLQLFILEGLDRELGEETLSFALPQNRILESLKDWEDTKVLYRPREQAQSSGGDSARMGFHTLGTIGEVLPRLAHEMSIAGISTPYTTEGCPWSRAIYLLSSAGVVDGRPDRWILTIAGFILDRLHGGSLMNEVIRGQRQARDRAHRVLITLWEEVSSASRKESISA
jgi:hypothetical protein